MEETLVTPRYHHWHHALEVEARDRNFAVHFPWIDRLFGTWYAPTGRWPSAYGLADEAVPAGYLAQLMYPFSMKDTGYGDAEAIFFQFGSVLLGIPTALCTYLQVQGGQDVIAQGETRVARAEHHVESRTRRPPGRLDPGRRTGVLQSRHRDVLF